MNAKPIENLGFQTLMVLEHLGRIASFGLRIVACLMVRPTNSPVNTTKPAANRPESRKERSASRVASMSIIGTA